MGGRKEMNLTKHKQHGRTIVLPDAIEKKTVPCLCYTDQFVYQTMQTYIHNYSHITHNIEP